MAPANRSTTDELRRKGLAEAKALLIEGGPDHVKARVLARRLGVSVGTVYNLFGQLDELLFLVNAEVYDDLLATIETAVEGLADDADPVERILALSQAYLSFVTERRELWSAVLEFNRRGRQSVPQWYRQREQTLMGVAVHAIENVPGARDDDMRALTARALWAAIHGIVTISVGRGTLLPSRREVADQIEIIVRSVLDALERGTLSEWVGETPYSAASEGAAGEA